ncbi:MAG: hypothetical protein HQM10_26430 [Candidatus Riflebacteria bacterium]|nr:hypothetical protein [Candidatus Riflebacteria bacterium]
MNRRGVAIIFVLVFSTGLLLFGLAYLNNVSSHKAVNPNQSLRAQIEVLAEGLSNIALLKYKELPSDFYYAYEKALLAPVAARDADPLNVFLEKSQAGSFLRGQLPDPNFPSDSSRNASYTTSFTLMTRKKYENDAILITTVVEKDGLRHEIKQTLYATRRRSN